MKKIIVLISVLLVTVSLTGCQAKEEVVKCGLNLDLTQIYGVEGSIESDITITHVDDIVVSVETIETVTIANSDYYDSFSGIYSQMESVLGEIEHYDIEVSREDGKIVFHSKIDYANLDINELLAVDDNVSGFLNDNNKVSAEKLQTVLTVGGVKCETNE